MRVSIPIVLTSTLALGAAVFALPEDNGTPEVGVPVAVEAAPSPETIKLTTVAQPAFGATDALAADHPLRRYSTLKKQQAALDDEIQSKSTARKELVKEVRATREEARSTLDALHVDSMSEAQSFLHKRRDALKARVDQVLAPSRLAPIIALRLDLDEHLSAARLNEICNSIHEAAHRVEDGLPLALASVDEGNAKRAARNVSKLVHDRVERPWKRLVDRRDSSAHDLGTGHDERATWAAERVEEIRCELHERIDCGVERSLESYSKSLHTRLELFDVPSGAESQGALEDVAAQLDSWAERFLTGTERALTGYESEVAAARRPLGAELDRQLALADGAIEMLDASVDAVLAQGTPTEAAEPDAGKHRIDWRRSAAAHRQIADVEHQMLGDATAARDILRPAANLISRALKDEEQLSDEAWQDLQESLRQFASQASSSCWKLDGPHLDGRHAPKAKELEDRDRFGRTAPGVDQLAAVNEPR